MLCPLASARRCAAAAATGSTRGPRRPLPFRFAARAASRSACAHRQGVMAVRGSRQQAMSHGSQGSRQQRMHSDIDVVPVLPYRASRSRPSAPATSPLCCVRASGRSPLVLCLRARAFSAMSILSAVVTVHRLIGLHPELGAVWASTWLTAGSAWTAAPVGETCEKRGKARGTSAGKALGGRVGGGSRPAISALRSARAVPNGRSLTTRRRSM